jgi:hypothetical protein
MKRPVLYIQDNGKRGHSLFDFGDSAKHGAEINNIKVKTFTDSLSVPGDPTNILVGSVEQCEQWLTRYGYKVPTPISLNMFQDYLGRNVWETNMDEITTFPIFVKPSTKIKAFTGFVADTPFDLALYSENYRGSVWAQQEVDIISEYRLYVTNNRVIGLKHYAGDWHIFPDSDFIQRCFHQSIHCIDSHSYTLDFGVLEDGRTILVEANDGWATGNYGLEPYDYYIFCRNRWLQMTGIRTRKECF